LRRCRLWLRPPPVCRGAHAAYLFVLAPRDTELDAHTGVVLHAMATITDKERPCDACRTRPHKFAKMLYSGISGESRALLVAHGASDHGLMGQAVPIRFSHWSDIGQYLIFGKGCCLHLR
jgi:hypothetical protein